MLLFLNHVDAATTVAESCGGGGSAPSNWERTRMRMSARGRDAVLNMPSGYVSLLREVKDMDVKHRSL